MSSLGTLRQTAGLVVEAADFAVHHPARTALRLVGAARAAARVLAGDVPRFDDDPEPGAEAVVPVEFSTPPVPEPAPASPSESFAHEASPVSHDDRHGGTALEDLVDWRDELEGDTEIITSAGTTGVAPGINPDTGLPNHAPQGG